MVKNCKMKRQNNWIRLLRLADKVVFSPKKTTSKPDVWIAISMIRDRLGLWTKLNDKLCGSHLQLHLGVEEEQDTILMAVDGGDVERGQARRHAYRRQPGVKPVAYTTQEMLPGYTVRGIKKKHPPFVFKIIFHYPSKTTMNNISTLCTPCRIA